MPSSQSSSITIPRLKSLRSLLRGGGVRLPPPELQPIIAELMDEEEMIARNEALEECEVDRRDEVGGGVRVKPPALVPVATESGSSDVIAADREEGAGRFVRGTTPSASMLAKQESDFGDFDADPNEPPPPPAPPPP